jgi:NAD(P)-dependent dehydrogenase (short-subunit alcohol dehydrogenase family)
MELDGKVAIVTGASAGIGRAYALALAGEGATVVALARTEGDATAPTRNSLAEVVAAASGLPGRVVGRRCDVANESDLPEAVDGVAAEFGRIDILVNNAGLMWRFDPLAISTADWDAVIRVNLRAPYLAIRAAAPHMIRQGSGSIINITAKAAQFIPKGERASDGTLVYAVSKAGLDRMSFFMAEELREHGIAVNALSPGIVLTDTALAGRSAASLAGIGKPPTAEVLGPALLYLARQSAATFTGQILHTDEFGKSWP